ncbi:MAG: ATP synthase F1 subunit delta [Bacteroidales bacterium]|nr:ATP synthase F1 subunit delta [Bacteroidales bacterium]
MNKSLLAERYARALIEYSHNEKSENEINQYMISFQNIWNELPLLRKAIEDPTVSFNEKLNLLNEATNGNIVMKKFFILVLKYNREIFLGRICRAFRNRWNEMYKIKHGDIIVASDIPYDIIKRIKEILLSIYPGYKLEITTKRNDNLIGGFILQVDSLRMDVSVKTQLKKIRNSLLESDIDVKKYTN